MMISASSIARRLAAGSPARPSSPKPTIVNQLDMTKRPIVLILGGTRDARALALQIAEAGISAVYSYAGRTVAPVPLPMPTRIGGFGGIDGLCTFLSDANISHIIDATHPFAETMSRHALTASERSGTPLIALSRPAWQPVEGDTWINAPDLDAAIAAMNIAPQRVFLAIGRQEVARFAEHPQHHYLLRFVDPTDVPPPLPDHTIITARGPFEADEDAALMREHRIDVVVSKNAGGSGAYGKIAAARALGLPVVMIQRPQLPERQETNSLDDIMNFLGHESTERGV